MKKLFTFALILLVISLAAFISCEHECSFSDEWQSSETEHWKNCEDETCDKKGSLGEHTFDEGVTENGVITYTCQVCGKTKTENAHVCDFDSAWTSDDNNHWHKCRGEGCSEISGSESHTYGEGVLQDGGMVYTCTVCSKTKTEDKTALYKSVCENIMAKVNSLEAGPTLLSSDTERYVDAQSFDYIQVKGVASFVEWLANMLDNDNFTITSAPVKFTYSYAAHGESGEATLLYKFDETNNKVTMFWYVQSQAGTRNTDIFLFIDVDYDFDTNTVGSFTLHSEQIMNSSQKMLLSYVYDGQILKALNRNIDLSWFEDIVDAYFAAFEEKFPNIVDLQADFTAEYTAMMNKMNPQSEKNNKKEEKSLGESITV